MSNADGNICNLVAHGVGRIWRFYYDGFRSMTIGKSLWVLILVKLFLLFVVLRMFFFPNVLKEKYDTDIERAEAVRSALVDK